MNWRCGSVILSRLLPGQWATPGANPTNLCPHLLGFCYWPPDIRHHRRSRVPAPELIFPYPEAYLGDNDNYGAGYSRRFATRLG